jgi:oligopeptidase A
MPCYLPVMQFAHSSALREKLYRAYVTRASDQAEGDARRSTTGADPRNPGLRLEEARLLGYRNFGEVSVVPKMAESPDQVITSCATWRPARPMPSRTWPTCAPFAASSWACDPQAWDWPYIGEKLKEARYAFSEQEVKQYFTHPRCWPGLFKIVETLFEVAIRRDSAPVWHPSVEFYRIERGGAAGGPVLPGPVRPHRQTRRRLDGRRARPLAAPRHRPAADAGGASGVQLCRRRGRQATALLTHDDVTTLFHEFGHGLHHMLTQVNERDVSGISGVEWDAVELPSQFMENFCWEWDVLRT